MFKFATNSDATEVTVPLFDDYIPDEDELLSFGTLALSDDDWVAHAQQIEFMLLSINFLLALTLGAVLSSIFAGYLRTR